ncbi:chromosome segregation in meiosis-related protein [Elasticomyces elasticus]|nr:chromosome segregation in meiosis-related protein [Elasticomyces elasticus]
MPSAVPSYPEAAPAANRDELDDLFNYDAGIDDIFKNLNNETNPEAVNSGRKGNNADAGLGIDEEIKITKRRAPVAKLDESRLLSQAGIPRLRKISKDRLRFRGKGHEFSDMSRLLNVYQLWLDDLYPRAKFSDALAMVEKLGHTKRMQTMRREWINEAKPKLSVDVDENGGAAVNDSANSETVVAQGEEPQDREMTSTAQAETLTSEPIHQDATNREPSNRVAGMAEAPEEDELDALLAEDASVDPEAGTSIFGTADTRPERRLAPLNVDEFEDEMEAMDGLDDVW